MQFISNFDDLNDMKRGLFDDFRVKPFVKTQHYHKIVKASRKSHEKFTDPVFPPQDSSLFFRNSPVPSGKVEWKRISDICEEPKLFSDGIDPGDVNQGEIGNCWFVAGLSLLATKKGLLTRVVPEWNERNNDDGRECGVYRFRFWRLGQWVEVVVDDFIPQYNGRCLYVHSRDNGEFWSSLIEKAYAKMCGSYEAMISGLTEDALTDFTGGITEKFELGDTGVLNHGIDEHSFRTLTDDDSKPGSRSLFDVCLDAMSRPAMLSAAIDITDESHREARTDLGLVLGHAYAVTAVSKLSTGDALIRLRNPWGQKEWTGAWSDGSKEWDKVSKKDRERFLVKDEDGEFWMAWNDFATHFTTLTITRLVNTSYFSLQRKWFEEMQRGSWDPNQRTAGGCVNNKETFCSENHQYKLDLAEDQTILAGLMQNDHRQSKRLGEDNFSLGFYVFSVELNRKYRLAEVPNSLAGKSVFINTRETVARLELKRGRYVLMPTTFSPNQAGEFLLRLYSETDLHLEPLLRSAPPQRCCLSYPQGRLVVRVVAATNLPARSNPKPYCKLAFEGQEARGFHLRDTTNPAFDQQFVFTLKKGSSPLDISVHYKRLLTAPLIGRARVDISQWLQTKGVPGTANVTLTTKDPGASAGTLHLEVMFLEGFPPRFNRPKPTDFEKGMKRRKSRRV